MAAVWKTANEFKNNMCMYMFIQITVPDCCMSSESKEAMALGDVIGWAASLPMAYMDVKGATLTSVA